MDPVKCIEGIWETGAFVDLQVNGFAGVDYNSPLSSNEEIAKSIRTMFSTGVTRFFPTVITGDPETMCAALRNLERARESTREGRAIAGFHVEGPHISVEDGPRGAHPKQWVRRPDSDEFRRWQDACHGNVRLVTLAPEWPEAPAYIEQLVRDGVVISIGHTRASAAQIRDAVSAGATLSTHLGNGADASLPRHPNYIWDQLAEDRLSASFIVDGLHLSESFLRVAVRAKSIDRTILVTDAVMPAMCAPGYYMLGEVAVELKADQRVVLRGGTRLAGSSLRMDRAVANVIRMADVPLEGAILMATLNPARIARLEPRKDTIRFQWNDGQLDVLETYIEGEYVYRKP
ncbi:MAG: amidohydrolase family protein [Acidobacteriota bacterium]